MKTTVEIDDTLLRAVKRAAVDRGTSMRALIEAGLRKELAAPRPRRRPLKIVTVPGGLAPGVDIASRQSMWEWFDATEKDG